MNGAAAMLASTPSADQRVRVALRLEVGKDLRYLSHHDEMRLLARALVRGRWPLAYSQGFNPLPKVVLPLPRRVGVGGEQWVLVDLTNSTSTHELATRLTDVLPVDYRLEHVHELAERVMPHATGLTYELELLHAEGIQVTSRLPALLAANQLMVQRRRGADGPLHWVDIRPYLGGMAMEGRWLRMHLRIEQQRTARPDELFTELGLSASKCVHRTHRRDIQWDIPLTGSFDEPGQNERNNVGQEDHDQEKTN